jgi:hypothetical protein
MGKTDVPWLTEYEAFAKSWAPFNQCTEIPLHRDPFIDPAWSPFRSGIVLDREPRVVDKKLQSNIVAAGTSSGPYKLCIIHQDARGTSPPSPQVKGIIAAETRQILQTRTRTRMTTRQIWTRG